MNVRTDALDDGRSSPQRVVYAMLLLAARPVVATVVAAARADEQAGGVLRSHLANPDR